MLFVYKIPFKFLLTCLTLICLYPIFGVIIISVIMKRLYYKEDIHPKYFIFPIMRYLFITVLLYVLGMYIETEDILVILKKLNDYLDFFFTSVIFM